MATIDRIRKRSGLVIVIVFVSLMAFVLGDAIKAFKGGADPSIIGTINGQEITAKEFQDTMNTYGSNSGTFQFRNYAWERFVMDNILTQELENSSLAMSNEELEWDVRNNPQTIQSFLNANGQFDPNSYNNFRAQMKSFGELSLEERNEAQNSDIAAAYNQWTLFKREVKLQSKGFKFSTVVEKALFMPEALEKIQTERRSRQHPAQFVYIPYIDVNESDLDVSDSDARAYYAENRGNFPQEEGRNVEFIDFPYIPSQADRDYVKADLAELALEWLNVEDDSLFIKQLSDNSFDLQYVVESELQGLDTLALNQEIGYQMGPIDLDSAFTIIKLVDKKSLPESVEARHILIPYVGAEGADASISRSPNDAYILADSLFNYLDSNRIEFDRVREEFSSDIEANEKGGSLGYLKRGSDLDRKNLRDFCFLHKEGKLGFVETEYGFHIVEITDHKGSVLAYKMGKIDRNIVSSKATMDAIETIAVKLKDDMSSAEDYRALAFERNYSLQPATNLGRFEELVPGLGNNREVISWAYESGRKEGDWSIQPNGDKGLVLVRLTDVLEEGYMNYERVADQCLRGAIKNAKKAIISNQVDAALASANSIEDIANALDKEVRSLNFSIGDPNVDRIGNEPEVVGAICGQKPGLIGPALEGNNGIFVAFSSEALPLPEIDYTQKAQDTQRQLRITSSEQAYRALEEKYNIERFK
jgi:peptidyl-prolyl cis-trans isomerase D